MTVIIYVAAIGMDSTAWLYVPKDCAAQQACKLVVALHGCLSNQETIGTLFVKGSGINEWADTNDIIVLYPGAAMSVKNSAGCWDWWGYTDSDFDTRSGRQIVRSPE